jgi:DNA-binding MarR family transcriptional regulator
MTDINSSSTCEADINPAIELLFFAYRDFVSDPDKVLASYHINGSTLGRAHHRVIHFVGRNPGISVAELLAILQITKQSLARVLRQLVDERLIRQERGQEDARQRLLSLTERGQGFELALSSPQRERFRKAFATMGPEAVETFKTMLLNLIDEDERQRVLRVIE